ncbi:hypothetical protein APR12_004933 [Nocardia amikacinitolerans]|uniref:WXG100 family type VII secretion target n=1 Tax=Nocardia amikacinitolerans TaxID=756689 RepID=UPI00082A7C7E|nr:hypothetical protein [Nocardia amikacinitolerans]MCP2319564.1 hypothetical protein [Nocardia amikacinitolerans]
MVDAPDISTNSSGSLTGVTSVEAVVQIAHGFDSDSILNIFSGAAALSIDLLGAATDPIGYVAGQLLSWMIENVGPVREKFNLLAGDPSSIKASASAWEQVQKDLTQLGADLASGVTTAVSTWTGKAASSYQSRTDDLVKHVEAMAETARVATQMTSAAGEFIAGLRTAIRDLLTALAGRLVSWALEITGTIGAATPVVVAQALQAIATSSRQTAMILNQLIKAIDALGPAAASVRDLVDGTFKSLAVFVNSSPSIAKTPSTA